MAKVSVPTNPDGSPRRHPETGRIWPHIELDEGESAIQTHPELNGPVTLVDGTTYDLGGVVENIVVVKNEHHDELLAIHEEKYAALRPPEVQADQ
jgi:hypothetical protein